MERKGGCCLAPRYGGGAGAGGLAGLSWQMGRIMLKFRPIAPKPAAMAPAPMPAPVAAAGAGKGKRKAVGGGRGGRRGRKPKKAAAEALVTAAEMVGDKMESEKEKSMSSSSSGMSSMNSSPPPPPPPQQPATLLLMPVSPVEEKLAVAVSVAAATEKPAPVAPLASEHAAGAQLEAPRPLRPLAAVAASWVTVEDVTATWLDGSEAPSASAATAAACAGGHDDSPAFVSDQWGRITWTNPAFARSVSGAGGDSDAAPAAALAGALPAWGTCAGFTCRVRVLRARGCGSVVAPCDAWRLDASGCYLWRLDLQVALTLGLGGLP